MSPSSLGHTTRAQFLQRSATALGAAAVATLLPSRLMSAEPNPSSAERGIPAAGESLRLDLREFVRWILESFEPSVRLGGGAGRYARKPGETVPELYGVADMACVLHTIGYLQPSEAERADWARVFQTFQTDPAGMLVEKSPTHGVIHNTATALAAMELLQVRPRRRVTLADEHRDPRAFLETIDWEKGVYPGSHRGAGLGAICALAPELAEPEWFDAYFAACEALFDPRNGLMGRNKPAGGDTDQVGGTFHYAFLFAHFNRLVPHPEARLDAVLRLQQSDGAWSADNRLWLTFDAMYLLTRTTRVCPHRRDEVVAAVRRSMQLLAREVFSVEGRAKTFSGKLPVHSLTAAVSAAAEAQQFLGHREIITERPLRLILDRRPFV